MSAEELQTLTPNSNQKIQPTDLPAGFQLPPLDQVRRDAAKLVEFIRNRDDAGSDVGVPGAINCCALLPNIFAWSYYAKVEETPDDLHEGCVFALRMFVRILQEGNEASIRTMIHTSLEDFAATRLATVLSAGHKLVDYLMLPEIDRPAEALSYLKMLVEDDIRTSTPTGALPWIRRPSLYLRYAEARALSGSTNTKTKIMLEGAIEGLMQIDSLLMVEIMLLKIHLAHVHRCQNIQTADAKENELYVIKFLRKNPDLIPPNYLKQALIRPGQPERHVLTALGGLAWFDDATKQTFKMQERVMNTCVTCGGCEPQKLLFRCGGCQYNWYCSKPCQVADWKTHKSSCRAWSAERKALEALRFSDPGEFQRKTDWMKWRAGPLGANHNALFHALGLRRDSSRGRTHIIFFNTIYTPDASRDMMHKFQIDFAGVYRILM
ncbi:hypothetical protein BJ138DRAFT_1118861 [Hygrophoropsis aurantiaca]|uniref:Uncharacterized protein n=1 Tax=Hygrophoropsis aurantiaca TaxID=72124 RepID=A0ACB7ZW69_9AGAM|nr:hypothetical protein BJ138DRAFT_1118861 [Hygrophoropsis aurantiaca]